VVQVEVEVEPPDDELDEEELDEEEEEEEDDEEEDEPSLPPQPVKAPKLHKAKAIPKWAVRNFKSSNRRITLPTRNPDSCCLSYQSRKIISAFLHPVGNMVATLSRGRRPMLRCHAADLGAIPASPAG
jgi:hypothetical protein